MTVETAAIIILGAVASLLLVQLTLLAVCWVLARYLKANLPPTEWQALEQELLGHLNRKEETRQPSNIIPFPTVRDA